MRFSPISFLLGLGAASVLPVVSRAFRPFAVEAAALGMTLVEEVRRIVAEQMENLEDIIAEARVRREETAAMEGLDDESESPDPEADATPHEPVVARPRGRAGRVRSQVP
jgi:hypothetical protein